MSKILGLALILASIYFLGQNITFTTHYYYSWWQKIPAAASVLTDSRKLWLDLGRSWDHLGVCK
jgi:hypothetical protein